MSEYGINSLSKRYMELDVSPQFDGYSGVEIVVDDETTYVAGNTDGRIITIQNPWGTQEQADNILSSLMGFQYQPYTASGALLNPAAELGDLCLVMGGFMDGMLGRAYKILPELPKVLGGLGIAIISTSKGVMTDKEARKLNVGGEVLAFVW